MTNEERKQLAQDVAEIIKASAPGLSDDEQRWVRMAIKKEAQSIELRQAIIEKSMTSLVWFSIASIGYLFVSWLKSAGLKI